MWCAVRLHLLYATTKWRPTRASSRVKLGTRLSPVSYTLTVKKHDEEVRDTLGVIANQWRSACHVYKYAFESLSSCLIVRLCCQMIHLSLSPLLQRWRELHVTSATLLTWLQINAEIDACKVMTFLGYVATWYICLCLSYCKDESDIRRDCKLIMQNYLLPL